MNNLENPLLNIGGTHLLYKEDVLGVFDLDTASTKTDTKRFLSCMEQKRRLENVANDLPKSFLVVTRGRKEKVYMTSLSTTTLQGRFQRQSRYL